MGKKDKKSKTIEKKARVAAKTSKKTSQKAKKNSKKRPGDDSESDDQDIDAILEEYEKKVSPLRIIAYQTLHMLIQFSYTASTSYASP